MVHIRHQCIVCKKYVVRMTPHVIHTHMDQLGSMYKYKLYANCSRLSSEKYRRMRYKNCPVQECPAIVAEMPLHLRSVHNFTGISSRRESKNALPVHTYDWQCKTQPMTNEEPDSSDSIYSMTTVVDEPSCSLSATPAPLSDRALLDIKGLLLRHQILPM